MWGLQQHHASHLEVHKALVLAQHQQLSRLTLDYVFTPAGDDADAEQYTAERTLGDTDGVSCCRWSMEPGADACMSRQWKQGHCVHGKQRQLDTADCDSSHSSAGLCCTGPPPTAGARGGTRGHVSSATRATYPGLRLRGHSTSVACTGGATPCTYNL